MRIKNVLWLSLFLIFLVGCSNTIDNPTTPSQDQQDTVSNNEYMVLNMGTMNLEDGTVEFSTRELNPYLNVTGIVGSNFSFTINGVVPPDILDLSLRINNVSGLTVYDVCIVFTDLYGKTVMNPDSYIDVFDPGNVNPFIAFRKEDANRAFPPGIDTEQLLLKFPSGASPFVDYMIIAHLGGNTGGVYELTDWNVDGTLTTSGGSATLTVRAKDHQDDVSGVMADYNPITDSTFDFIKSVEPEIWEATISNTQGAPAGTYPLLIMATSSPSPAYMTYNYFDVTVTDDGAPITSVNFVPLPQEDTTYDICVAPDGPVYVAADHPATGNTNSKRTALRFENNLTGLTVLNSGTGLNHNNSLGFTRIEVSDAGYVYNNPDGIYQSCWSDDGSDTLSNVVAERILGFCTTMALGDLYTTSEGSTNYCVGIVTFSDCLMAQKSVVWPDTNPVSNWGGGMFVPPNYNYDTIVGIDGVPGTVDAIFFISKGTEQFISRSGDWLTSHGDVSFGIQTGVVGFDDGQFSGGKDVAVDTNGNIITLESHPSDYYRFQKFDSDMNWVYTSDWADDGDPKRMDFDMADNRLYVLTSSGVHEMSVQ